MKTFRDNTVQIFGYRPPLNKDGKQITWYLSVQEKADGIVEKFPTFLPFEKGEGEVRSPLHEGVWYIYNY